MKTEKTPAGHEYGDHEERRLRELLAALTNFSNYDVTHQWQAELNHENAWILYGGAAGVEYGSKQWRQRALRRDWWAAIRLEAGLRLQDVADQLGVNKATVSRWESGERDPSGAEGDAYKTWLIEQRQEIIEAYQEGVYRLAAIRDHWPKWPTGAEHEAIWREFFRAGGWVDQWRSSGVLPNTNRLEPIHT